MLLAHCLWCFTKTAIVALIRGSMAPDYCYHRVSSHFSWSPIFLYPFSIVVKSTIKFFKILFYDGGMQLVEACKSKFEKSLVFIGHIIAMLFDHYNQMYSFKYHNKKKHISWNYKHYSSLLRQVWYLVLLHFLHKILHTESLHVSLVSLCSLFESTGFNAINSVDSTAETHLAQVHYSQHYEPKFLT